MAGAAGAAAGQAHRVERGEREGYSVVVLASEELRASVAPQVGMVVCSLEHDGEELLAGLGTLADYARKGTTMGIPLLHPWANRLSALGYSFGGRDVVLDRESALLRFDGNGLPIHGLLTASPHWAVRETRADAGAASLTAELDFGVHDELMAAFPYPHVVRLDVRLTDTRLEVRTTVTATGGSSVPISFGYHPYLRLPGAARELWEIEIPARRRLVLDERMIPTGETEPFDGSRRPLGDRTFDDGFAELADPARFVAAGGGRELSLTFVDGYPYAQVFSPPGAAFICFEPMTAPTDALRKGDGALPVVEPSESFSAAFELAVRRGASAGGR